VRFGERTISEQGFSLVESEFPLLQSTICRVTISIRGPSRWLLSSRSRATSFSLCKQIKKTFENISRLDDCKLTNAKLYLNSECYPYDDLNLDFNKNRCAILYDLYACFCKNRTTDTSISSRDSSLQLFYVMPVRDHRLLSTERIGQECTVDMRLDFKCKENVPANTIAYYLIMSRGSV